MGALIEETELGFMWTLICDGANLESGKWNCSSTLGVSGEGKRHTGTPGKLVISTILGR